MAKFLDGLETIFETPTADAILESEFDNEMNFDYVLESAIDKELSEADIAAILDDDNPDNIASDFADIDFSGSIDEDFDD